MDKSHSKQYIDWRFLKSFPATQIHQAQTAIGSWIGKRVQIRNIKKKKKKKRSKTTLRTVMWCQCNTLQYVLTTTSSGPQDITVEYSEQNNKAGKL